MRTKKYRHLVFISVDNLRFDGLSSETCKTYLRRHSLEKLPATPALDRLAAGGFRFSGCRSVAPNTVPSHASLFTGTYPFRNGVRRLVGDRLKNAVPNLWELLEPAGFEAAAGTDLPSVFQLADLFRGIDPGKVSGVPKAIETAARIHRSGKKCALFLHLNDVHDPYGFRADKPMSANPTMTRFYRKIRGKLRVPKRSKHPYGDLEREIFFGESNRNRSLAHYLIGVNEFDRGRFREILRAIENGGILDESLLILTSDHGEAWIDPEFICPGRPELFPNSYFGHSLGLDEELLRVPLIIWDGGRNIRPGTHDVAVSGADVLPTILQLLGIRVARAPRFDGVDRSAMLLREGPPPKPSECYAESWVHGAEFGRRLAEFLTRLGSSAADTVLGKGIGQGLGIGGLDQRSLRQGDLKWIERAGRRPLLFDLRSDPYETSNLEHYSVLHEAGADRLGVRRVPDHRKAIQALRTRLGTLR